MKTGLRAYLIAAGAFTAVAFLGMIVLEGNTWPNAVWTDTVLVIAAWAGTACLVAAAVKSSPGARWKWGLLATGLGLEAVAETVWWIYEIGMRVEVPFPGPADAFYLAGYFVLAAGLLAAVPRHESWLPRAQAVMDAMFITATLVLVSWVTVVHAVVDDAAGGGRLETAVYVAYPTVDVLLAGLALTFIARSAGQAVQFMGLLAGGILIWAVGDSAYLLLDIRGVYGGGYPTDISWVIGYLMIGATAFLPLPDSVLHWRPARWQQALPWVFLLGALVIGGRELILRPMVGAGYIVTVAAIILASAGRQSLAIVEVERLQLQTRHEAETVRAYVENARDLVLVIDGKSGRALYANPATLELLGTDMTAFGSKGPLEFTHPDDRAETQQVFQRAMDQPGQPIQADARAVRADGEVRTVSFTVVDRSNDPLIGGLLINARDVTEERRRQEAEVQAEQVERLAKERQRLLNGAAHVLNTPLTPAMLQLVALRSPGFGPLTKKQQDALDNIQRNLHRMQRTTEDIITAFRIQSDSPVEPLRVDVAGLVEECIVAEDVGVNRRGDDGPAWALVDKQLTRQAIRNLIRHAADAPADTLDVSIHAAPDGVSITVREPREGLTDGQAQSYLEPFGTGLGAQSGLSLYTCRTAVEKQGGSLIWQDGAWVLALPADASGAASAAEP